MTVEGGVQFGPRFVARSEIYEHGAQAASGLASIGVGRGDVVATFLRNDVTCFESAIAAATLGAHIVPINWHSKSDETRYILEDSGAKVLVAHTDLLDQIDGAVPYGVKTFSVPTVAGAGGASAPAPAPAPGTDDWGRWLEGFEPWAEPSQTPEYSMNYTSGTTGRPKGVRRDPITPDGREALTRMFRELRVGPGVRTIVAAPLYHAVPFGFSMGGLWGGR